MKKRKLLSFVFLLFCSSLVGCEVTIPSLDNSSNEEQEQINDYTIIKEYFAKNNNYADETDDFYGIQQQIGAITALMSVDKNENDKVITIGCIQISETDSSGSVFYGSFAFEYGNMLEPECIIYTRFDDGYVDYKCEFQFTDFVFDDNGCIDFTYVQRTQTFNNFPSSWYTTVSSCMALAETNLKEVISYYTGYLKAKKLPALR